MGKKGKYNKNVQEEEEPRKKKMMITEEHLMDKTHMDSTDFLALLSEDSLYPPFETCSAPALRKIVKDLNYLLVLDFKNFWATLLYNPALKNCLNSCLKHLHRKWLNNYYHDLSERRNYYELISDREEYELTTALTRVVLVLHFRILNAPDENPQLTNLYRLSEQIHKKFLFDFPRLMEVIEIYGNSNPDAVKMLVRAYLNLSPNFYSELKSEYLQILLQKMNRDLSMIKKISERQEFGIEYSYKRNPNGDLSPGEEELKKKVCLLMQFVSFYRMIDDINEFFPEQIGELTRFHEQIHILSENLFIEIEQAYKTWSNHDMGSHIYPLMDLILQRIIKYFVDFLEKCDHLFVKRTIKSNTIGAYLKCLDRMLQDYGKRASAGKKGSNKKHMELYKEILKQFKLDEFLSALYVDEIENGTHGINIEYLVDFKLAIDEEVIRSQGGRRELQDNIGMGVAAERDEDLTEAGNLENDDRDLQQEIQQLAHKIESRKHSTNEDMEALDRIVAKRNRSDNYYQNLYSEYRNKYTAEYDDEYDDLVDYEKRPMFEDNQKEEADSSDASFDSQEEELHLVKSQSNQGRNRAHYGGAKQMNADKFSQNSKYDRKNKAKYVPVKEQQIQQMLKTQEKPEPRKYEQKREREEQKRERDEQKRERDEQKREQAPPAPSREYEDEECLQDCKAKIEENPGHNKKYKAKGNSKPGNPKPGKQKWVEKS